MGNFRLLGYALRLNDEHGTERGSDANNGYLTNIDGKFEDKSEYFYNL